FNDFTKVRFWKYRRIKADALGEARVIARFEGGDPALIEKVVGTGRLFVLTSGWAPADSQLARSSKFVPLMGGLLEGPGGAVSESALSRVGDPVRLPPPKNADEPIRVATPSGASLLVPAGERDFKATNEPGVYTSRAGTGSWSFAVNLDPAESRTAPLAVETLQQLGCKLAGEEAAAPDAEHRRQLQNAELEGRQKLWRWLIVAVTAILIVETWIAGRQSRSRPAAAEVLTP
ncbi:MAG: hypothetical protein U0794_21340, partial [Isosphaeraceae bacterium]